MNTVTSFLAVVLVCVTAIVATVLATDCRNAAILGAVPLGISGSGSSAVFETAVDEAKANKLFHDAHGKDACHEIQGTPLAKAAGYVCPSGMTLVANCTDGTHVYAPAALYVRGRPDTGGYTRRNNDPEPVVVPLSYDWCAQ